MPVSREFIDYVAELFAPLGRLRSKRMFGGVGVYADELMFAFLVDDVLYLRVDALSEARFREAGAEPFTFAMKDGRQVEISYWRAPEEALEDPDAALSWGRLAVEAALRKRGARTRPKR